MHSSNTESLLLRAQEDGTADLMGKRTMTAGAHWKASASGRGRRRRRCTTLNLWYHMFYYYRLSQVYMFTLAFEFILTC
jgi:hypothetical protein